MSRTLRLEAPKLLVVRIPRPICIAARLRPHYSADRGSESALPNWFRDTPISRAIDEVRPRGETRRSWPPCELGRSTARHTDAWMTYSGNPRMHFAWNLQRWRIRQTSDRHRSPSIHSGAGVVYRDELRLPRSVQLGFDTPTPVFKVSSRDRHKPVGGASWPR